MSPQPVFLCHDILSGSYNITACGNYIHQIRQAADYVSLIVNSHHVFITGQVNTVCVLTFEFILLFRRKLYLDTCKVRVALKRTVSVHRHSAYNQTFQVSVLGIYILVGVYDPRIYLVQISLVSPCAVCRCLPCRVGEVSVNGKFHGRTRMHCRSGLQCISKSEYTGFIFYNLRRRKVCG